MFSRLARNSKQIATLYSKRNFSAPAAPKEYTGLEAAVRKYLPEDYQISIAVFTIEFGGLALYFLLKGKKEEPKIEAPAPVASTEDSIPSMFDEAFEEWSKVKGNLERWEESFKNWEPAA
eukprot:snap_masked-scaffold_72-processed-gene-0.36-mRNA-1 protein AED:1.00 eAED:1.00 QI:0/-1/0/0/-1/1/1/0/119